MSSSAGWLLRLRCPSRRIKLKCAASSDVNDAILISERNLQFELAIDAITVDLMSRLIGRRKTEWRSDSRLTQDVHFERVISLVDLLQRSNRNSSMCTYRFCSAIREEREREMVRAMKSEGGQHHWKPSRNGHSERAKREPKAESKREISRGDKLLFAFFFESRIK